MLTYDAVPPAVREVIDARMLARIEELDDDTAGAIDAALTLTGGPIVRALALPKRGKAGVPDRRTLEVEVMLPTGQGHWQTWFTLRLRGPYVRDLVSMLTTRAPDTPEALTDP